MVQAFRSRFFGISASCIWKRVSDCIAGVTVPAEADIGPHSATHPEHIDSAVIFRLTSMPGLTYPLIIEE